ncbi:hypothetical protein ERICIV_03568 [Paenibacillus larvae subsp. larvae]|uniref:Uncharacterized protein n=1 Tax=Paenibacillus larvae subsp. larvae TaxID=147375 RepID=A0A2L1U4T5_9BACL|nr:hypothetical protein [Paenibacillus larvae]AQT84279.1 hypothetical protein B1222_07490 [Paenibacillus larvae subsp. pulvifaciens]AQZ46256.1 hypothetical protein B5S25_06075 [Paenibacillus larvae subsp. pulvifaciens]AVF27930.1 hypothetical protein ERICIII_03826 [Paenibacillus larvae subsp. larvae]AVF32432.1 hypothetical protein ERICIV_03568 [Paenibacillus larvae subsp. larvae]MBH0343222.1 hypothetical protein [Paenibacillus larvae]
MGDYLGSVRNYYDHLTEFNGPPEGMFVVILKILLWSNHTDTEIVERVRNLVKAYDQVKELK